MDKLVPIIEAIMKWLGPSVESLPNEIVTKVFVIEMSTAAIATCLCLALVYGASRFIRYAVEHVEEDALMGGILLGLIALLPLGWAVWSYTQAIIAFLCPNVTVIEYFRDLL